ncbi:Carboxysome shell and ethanolamine utilization microcompartment protein CcmL/EutN [Gracilibacillus ureilyticus]|uniref:Carboxysome shell and ethanolamine utilization microcompartment protein CcmL/EutN n=1 Tax=Gracilibacillus ureilyticus TaxID=531814 RepID=A0A1H9P052_9BACI|nr:BMC domain-containing protein [Gracilibacillus ureilyticus]SER41596.1 Carboxysome shell and ethanolamine utilization microcompartment protein CcmL/EutN [Gracilibacillus ureilyticus]
MKKYEAIGVIETKYFAVGMEMLDQVSKTAAVEFLSSQNQLGGKLVSIMIGGSISDVTLAIETAKQVNERKTDSPLKNAVVITNPHEEILRFVVPQPKQVAKKRPAKPNTAKSTKKQEDKPIEEENNNE